MNKSIISKLTFDDLSYNTRIPNGYSDNNIYSKLKWDSNNTPTVINSNNIKVMQIKTNTDRIHVTSAFTNSASIINGEWEVEANIKILTLNSNNGYFGWSNQHSKYLGIYIRNSFNGGLSLTSTGGKEVSFNYRFEANKEYNIIVSYIAYNFRLIINGEHIGVVDGKEFVKSLVSSNTILMMFGSVDGSSTDAMTNGELWNMNVSLGGGVKNEDASHLTKYGANLLSRLNFDNLNTVGTTNISVSGLEAVMNSTVTWDYDSTKINKYTINTTLTTNINNNFTALIKMSNNKNRTDVGLITYGNYKVTYNYISIGEPEPIVVVDTYTKSALDFENGLADKVTSTNWSLGNSAKVQNVNKIYGDYSLETKLNGDDIQTPANLITGNGTPYTVEYHFLYKGKWTPAPVWDAPIFTRYTAGDIGNYLNTSTYNISFHSVEMGLNNSSVIFGKSKLKPNEINKVTMSYDGAAIRMFINDKLDNTLGTNVGFITRGNQPYRFFSRFADDQSTNAFTSTFGLLDNINIFDGVAKKVRDYDQYEDNLIVDLAFDGENNSTKIVDNGTLKSTWTAFNTAVLSTEQPFDGFSSLKLVRPQYIPYISSDKDFSEYFGKDFSLEVEFILTSTLSANEDVSIIQSKDTGMFSFSLGLNDLNSGLHRVYFETYGVGSSYARITHSVPYFGNNKKYKLNYVRKGTISKVYINGVLVDQQSVAMPKPISTNKVYIAQYNGNGRGLTGYVGNFKLYEDVEVIPENPTGKVQLDFDNNLNDNYNTSNWTNNNGVTFDQVNSVKGYSAFFSGTSNISTTANSNLNFENKNFNINMDIKPTNKTDWGVLIASNTTNVNVDESVIFWTTESNQNKMTLNMVNNSINYTTVGESGILLNNYYNVNASVVNNVTNLKINDVIISQLPNLPITRNFNFNFGNGTKIGTNVQNTSYVNYKGFIDNFKSQKDNTNFITKFESNVPSTSINLVVNDGLVITHTGTTVKNGTFVLNDSPTVKDYIVEVSGYIPQPNIGYLISFKSNTSDYSIMPNDFTSGYSFGLIANVVLIYKGQSNTSTVIIDNKPLPSKFRDGKYHIFKVVKSGNNIKLYIDEELISDVTDTTYSNYASTFALSYSNSPDSGHTQRSTDIKYFKVYDLNMNILYDNHFKSNVNTIIDKAAVHLPLETNSNNIGFTPLTINAVGSPTYTTIDNKKCIKFDSGKYLTINSNNIFNLGTSSDFYIEFDFYPIKSTNGLISNTSAWTSGTIYLIHNVDYITLQSWKNNVVTNITTINKVVLNSWNNVKLYRKGSIVYISLNDIVVQSTFNVDIDFCFSGSNLSIGTYGTDTNLSGNASNAYMSNFKMFVGTSEIPETYNDKKVLDLTFEPTRKSYLFKDKNNKCIIHPVNITQRDYQDSQYCCTFNGVDQYLQLGKNDLFNFGLDDFVLYFKINIRNIDSTSDKDDVLIYNNIAWNTGSVGISRYVKINKLTMGIYGTSGFISDNTFVKGINEIYIIRQGSTLIMKLNDISTTFTNFNYYLNFNGGDNTFIGKAWDSSFNTYFGDIIYSVKVLRNTTDLTLLDEVGSRFEESFTLSNGTDSQTIINDVKKDNHNIRFIKDTDKSKLIVDGEFVEVPSVENTTNELILFDNYNSEVKDVKLYNTVFEDEDIFLGSKPIDTEFGEIEYHEDNSYELEIPEGDYTLKGFIEGYTDRNFFIYNTFLNYEIFRGIEYFDIKDMNQYSLDDYEINDLVTGNKYPVLQHEMIRGYISGTVNLSSCGVKNTGMKVYCHRNDNHRLIGIYDIDINGRYTIPNLDVNSYYDIIFKTVDRKLENISSSYRKPVAY